MRADTEDSGLVSQLKANAIWLLPLLAIILVLLVQWPQLHLTYIFHQDDTMPQLRRMESYVTSVRHGSYFPKVFPEEVRNFGYAFDAFYPSLLLLPYVWLRLAGMGIVSAYYGYQTLILVATVVTAYVSFCGFAGSHWQDSSLVWFTQQRFIGPWMPLYAGLWARIWRLFSCR